MTLLAHLGVWAGLILLAYTFAGYPLLLWLLSKVRPKPVSPQEWTPTLSVCIAAHNPGAQLERKIAMLRALDYPQEKLQIVVASDGSTDGSAERLHALQDDRLRVLIHKERRGKSTCLRDAIQAATGELLVFNDIRQRVSSDALRRLANALASGELRAVSGLLRFTVGDPELASAPESVSTDAYWRYESALRQMESQTGSVVGVSGALYAVRREHMPLPPAGIVLDDLWVPLQIAAQGGRIGLELAAVVWDQPSPPAVESVRKRRTLAGNWQLLAVWPGLLLPWRNRLWWRYVSHKLLRLLTPWMLLSVGLGSAFLALDNSFYGVLVMLQLLAYAGALAGMAVPRLRQWFPIRILSAFLDMNYYALLGTIDYLRRRDAHLWQITANGPAASVPMR